MAFAFARVLAFFSLRFVAVRGLRDALGAAFFSFFSFFSFISFLAVFALGAGGAIPSAAITAPGSMGRSGTGRRAEGACFAIMTSTDSDGRAPLRIQFANFSVSIWNLAGSVRGS